MDPKDWTPTKVNLVTAASEYLNYQQQRLTLSPQYTTIPREDKMCLFGKSTTMDPLSPVRASDSSSLGQIPVMDMVLPFLLAEPQPTPLSKALQNT